MISFFPTPYPDELWYSVICRYHIRSGNPCVKHTLQQLYGEHYYNASLTLCGPVQHIFAQFPDKLLSSKQIILGHTLYPYYARFFSASRKRTAYGYVQSGDPRAVHRLGLYQSGFAHHTMRYCPVCFAEDIAQYGELYWHRLHQLPDIQICPKHHSWLVNTDVSDESSRQLTLCLPTLQMQLAAPPGIPIPEPLLALNTAMQDTLTTPFNMANGDTYRAVFDQRLRDCGWRSLTGGRTYAGKIESALLSFYGSSVSPDDISSKQLHATLSQKNVSTRHILELATFWGLSLHDLLSPSLKSHDYKGEMQEMYTAGTSMYTIAKLYGVDAKTVARWVKG